MELFGFGPHLMVDGYDADPARLRDAELVRRVLDELPEEMAMTKVLPPFVYRYGPEGEDGVTGVVIIAESHIAIHTFPKKRFLSIDIFSCKAFDMAHVLRKLTEVFQIGRYETYMIHRGKEFPKDPELARQIVLGEREYLQARVG
ncbi:adenosylmethionine decarboxylase [Thermus thermamylovorans]|uniref:Adenosylmethionine decarboxylase n=1 Tax=Thermus thermamylovorans TaxID=2509362 RepID=A0A4Q9B5Q8_9DEIN|nr:adenosylmethionine decarboxylase [Thermus thermamylovorans]TBH20721.1 adenosylmethionine decarboxylase [Thermus thermamylovorans]